MAGRHAASDYAAAPHHVGEHLEVARDSGPFWAYLDSFTWPRYARDFFTAEQLRWIIGFVCAVVIIVGGVVRMFTDPGWSSLGLIMMGAAVAVLSFIGPLVLDLLFAYAGGFLHKLHRPRGRRRRRR
ncbi:MAG: hypothetical protein ACTHJM_08845 [Marmoricola sp.]